MYLLIFITIIYNNNHGENTYDTNYDINHNYIYIPKISLVNEIYDYDNDKNNVDKNVYMVTKYNFNNPHGSLVLAAHSGNGYANFFNRLDELIKDDEIIIESDDYLYTYLVTNIYTINKNGNFKFYNKDKYIYLITCLKNHKKKQLVVKGFLKKITKKSTFY